MSFEVMLISLKKLNKYGIDEIHIFVECEFENINSNNLY